MLHLLSFLSTFPFSFSSKLHTPFSSPLPFLSWLLPYFSRSPLPFSHSFIVFSFPIFSFFLTPHSACASLLPSLLDFLVFFLHSSLFPVLTSFPSLPFLHLSPSLFHVPFLLLRASSPPLLPLLPSASFSPLSDLSPSPCVRSRPSPSFSPSAAEINQELMKRAAG